MRVLLLDNEKITKMTLPDEVDGVFLMKYHPSWANAVKDVMIEAREGKWVLKSNESINVIINNKIEPEITLEEHMHLKLLVVGNEEMVDFYCLPTLDNQSTKVTVCSQQILIGNTAQCAIVFHNEPDGTVFGAILNNQNNWFLVYPDNFNGTPMYVNDKILKGKVLLKTGDVIFLKGLKMIWMHNFMHICSIPGNVTVNNFFLPLYAEGNYDNANYKPVTDEEQSYKKYKPEDYFFHRPSLKEYVVEEEIMIDAPPGSQLGENTDFLTTFGASFTMIASSFVSIMNLINSIQSGGSKIAIISSTVMCVSMLFGSLLIPRLAAALQKRKCKKNEKIRIQKYTEYINDCDKKIKEIMAKQAQILRDTNLNVNGCINLLNTSNYWNREIKDEDFLIVRTGTGNVDAKIKISAPEKHFTLQEDALMEKVYSVVNSSRTLENVPVNFNFVTNRVSAIISNVSYGEKFINSIIMQLATLHSCQDLKLVFLINDDEDNYDWEYAKYLPHVFSDDKQKRYFASSYDEMKSISADLENIFKERQEIKKAGEEKEKDVVEDSATYKAFEPYYVLITNDIFLSKSLPIFEKIMSANENYGFSILFTNESMNKLPKRCNSFIALAEGSACILERDINSQINFIPEYLDGVDIRTVCNRLNNIPVLSGDIMSSLPTSISFLEVFGASKIEQLNIINRWKVNDPTLSLKAQIGVHASGEQFFLDLHEKQHGPHGLIAGSTGSGKSEFIMTYILSLAVNYHPDEVQFVLIDYKGGGLAGAFENREKGTAIPHLAGTITNLDTASMNRSLVSINSELKRREQMFMDARDDTGESTLDIYKYQKYYRAGVLKEPMSHLFIISDEFAELKAQQPEFMDELISTARVGRSLGVHLILATQKPSGVVNDQIWSNSKFKICLKVQTAGDSNEMLKKPDAASIKETGRFYLQVGYDEYFAMGQSGWAGAKYVPSDKPVKKIDDSVCFINNIGETTKSITDLVKKETGEDRGDQLTNIVKLLCDWSKNNNYQAKQLWLDPIPEEIFIGNVTQKYGFQPEPYKITPVIGEYDFPQKQKQGLLTLDLNKGNTYIFGKNGAGKEDLISTILYSTCVSHTPEEVNFYVVDMGAGTLRAFLRYPHVGDVVTIDDGDKVIDLFALAEREIGRRKELTVDFGGSFETYNQMNPDNKLPLMVVIINNLDVFTENFSKISDLIVPLYRDGAKYGVTFIITCIGVNTLRAKVREYFTNHISLVCANKDDYFSLFTNYRRGLEPAQYKGRGLVAMGKEVLEFQSALINSRAEINTTIKSTCDALNEKYKDSALKQLPSIPKVVNVENFLEEVKELKKIPLGYNAETKEEFYFDFASRKVNLISSNDLTQHLPFLNALVMELKVLNSERLDVQIIDVSGYFDILTIGLTCYQSNFNDTFGRIIEQSQNLEKETLYVFTGIGELKSNVDPNNMPFVNDWFNGTKDNDKIHFIFIESYENLNTLKIEDWYMNIVDNTYGIWLGGDVGSQTVINFSNLSSDDRTVNSPEYCFVAEKGKRKLIKNITCKNEEDGEE